MPEVVFELARVTVRYGALTALQDVSLRIEAGERVALIGPSGAGKSTLLSVLNGSIAPTSGGARLLGQDTSQLSARALRHVQRQIGTIYQQFNLVPNLSVIHNVNAGHLGRWSLARAALSLIAPLEREVAAQALANVGIADKLYARTDTLSGGQQQRVAIARALVNNPSLILADEPTGNLDSRSGAEIMQIFRQLNQTMGITIILVTHEPDIAAYTRRIIRLQDGLVVSDAPNKGYQR